MQVFLGPETGEKTGECSSHIQPQEGAHELHMLNKACLCCFNNCLTCQVIEQRPYVCVCGCRWSQTYQEGGHYSVWIQGPDPSGNHTCSHSIDRPPNNAYLRKSSTYGFIEDCSEGWNPCSPGLWSYWVKNLQCGPGSRALSHLRGCYWSDQTSFLENRFKKKKKDFLPVLKPRPRASGDASNTSGSLEGLGRNGILKASFSIMYTVLNNIADYVVDQTFKAKQPLSALVSVTAPLTVWWASISSTDRWLHQLPAGPAGCK